MEKSIIEEVFYWEIQIIVTCKQILILESSKGNVLINYLGGLIIRRLLCEYRGDSLFTTKNEILYSMSSAILR